jgi:hypothetical protein
MAMALGIAQADHHMEGEHPPMAPEVILGPPDDFHPPEEDPPPEMPADPAEAEAMVLEHFFMFMDADGSGAIDMEEFLAWVRGVHMPEMMEPPHDPDMEFDPDPMGGEGDEGEMDGLLREGDGDLADLNLAPECSDELRDSEQSPQATNHPCEDLEGNLIFRTICNMPGYDWVAISLPTDRAAGCFGLEALRGEIGFEIVSEDGSVHVFDTTMGKEAYMDLKIDGPSVYHIKSTGGSPDGAVTLRFVDVSTAGM